ncbi:hypothetical protein C7B65_04800 [Phormidesmis priestleyi ULC007]|uniref:Uncharacterized protein n=1 Tax=Phormidesmis priestleyi ULC007 TaxID=1920490 RepID=A0A2T1DLC1_9CYAN|nr:type IV pilin-like G/H family protein [Phormidesmis priestleyi]PSB21251.1 hypothetical protein C7B65_04800 [Phormidesmis priestleyi ULC007]PZO51221.1 MAG: hypothetical protein DCF14_08905 [Phormidesmis priestleyi]
MDQPHLLELAKQGSPTAIAVLINAVLNPHEIQAQAKLKARCLCIFLESNQTLSQETLVKFVERGLLKLNIELIDTVEICSRKPGESSFSWVRKFEIKPIVQLVSVDLVSPTEDRHDSLDLADPDRGLDESEFEEEQAESGSSIPTYFRAYSILFVLAIVVGFMSGGMIVAFISTSQAENQTAAETEGVFLDESIKKQTPQEKQQKAESYLKAMNVAQAKFYRQNQRFASSLEELERSTNLISQSYDYAYKLRVADESRAEIAAIPKAKGLKSYVGAVVVTDSKTDDIVCKAKNSSIESLPIPEFSRTLVSKTLRCPSRSSQVN